MKKYCFIFLILFPLIIKAQTKRTLSTFEEVKSGDIILIALNCYSCSMIETEEGGDYSHSGVVIKVNNKLMVAQALGKVHLLPLESFIAQARKKTKVTFVRPLEFYNNEPDASLLLTIFKKRYDNLPFDPIYLWSNYSEQEKELLYCSEFVAKFLNNFLDKKFLPRPMDFSDNWDFWNEVYNGKVPQGEPGNSPVSLYNDPNVKTVKIFFRD